MKAPAPPCDEKCKGSIWSRLALENAGKPAPCDNRHLQRVVSRRPLPALVAAPLEQVESRDNAHQQVVRVDRLAGLPPGYSFRIEDQHRGAQPTVSTEDT